MTAGIETRLSQNAVATINPIIKYRNINLVMPISGFAFVVAALPKIACKELFSHRWLKIERMPPSNNPFVTRQSNRNRLTNAETTTNATVPRQRRNSKPSSLSSINKLLLIQLACYFRNQRSRGFYTAKRFVSS